MQPLSISDHLSQQDLDELADSLILTSSKNFFSGCIECSGSSVCGYGRRKRNGRFWLAHRISFSSLVGEIPQGMLVLHRCDNPACINPAHLFLGTNLDNNKDRDNKGRTHKGESHRRAKLTVEKILSIRSRHLSGESMESIAEDFNVCGTTIGKIIRKERWKHV